MEAEKVELSEFIEDLRKSNGNLQKLLEKKLSEVKEIKRREHLPEEISYIRGQLDLLQIQGEGMKEIMQRSSALQDPRLDNEKATKN